MAAASIWLANPLATMMATVTAVTRDPARQSERLLRPGCEGATLSRRPGSAAKDWLLQLICTTRPQKARAVRIGPMRARDQKYFGCFPTAPQSLNHRRPALQTYFQKLAFVNGESAERSDLRLTDRSRDEARFIEPAFALAAMTISNL
jgi:hypothetical protein